MKQILQSARSGDLDLVEVPAPAPQTGQVLVRNHFSVVSPGTERLMMEFAQKSLVAKARSRPDLVRQVVRKVRHDGPLATYRTVVTRLEAPQPLGYSCAGVVEAVGGGVERLRVGDRVACAGAGYANHAEFVVVPENLAARVPAGLSLDRAAFATIASIALQGVRISEPTLGEVALVVGLGLIGQLTVQFLRANGCRVIGVDLSEDRVNKGKELGAEWAFVSGQVPESWVNQATDGYGVDLALVTAASESAGPIQTAAELCRLKARVVVVGMMPMELDRRTFYDKELELRMSTSYGPGRYDRSYEESGLDYPLPYVRWTETRNMESFLALAAQGAVDPANLALDKVPFESAKSAYTDLSAGRMQGLGVVFEYGEAAEFGRTQLVAPSKREPFNESLGVALIGAGNYAKGVLLPALSKVGKVALTHVVAATGPSALRTGERHGFASCGTDPSAVFSDPSTNLVVIATRHDSHADLAKQALKAGKAVWLEKPAAIHPSEVEELAKTVAETDGFLAIGYNRRFSAHSRRIREEFANRSAPLAIQYRIAAGPTPSGTWLTDPEEGGGRIVGEVCHFVDLCVFLVGWIPERVYAMQLSANPERDDSMVAVLEFPDGSSAVIEYLAQTGPEVPKERFEVSGGGRTLRCENFRSTQTPAGRSARSFDQDKGQETALAEVITALRTGEPSPFCIDEIVGVSEATFAIRESISLGVPVALRSAIQEAP